MILKLFIFGGDGGELVTFESIRETIHRKLHKCMSTQYSTSFKGFMDAMKRIHNI